ncbi:DUF4175 domain-containing protein [Polyangium sp. 6x1]|uniref:DUF4175 domain-containing protein n=1 Tax=Polyangium sp. 6x1 TaxID=3042689 RepID=UPI002482BD88|nr:DUF4175 domain-containing protein [Polyangium sp. 6x1]MDI1449314.1 DUF4175 domain-containing protein [Polyangium sp. 6x1]
MEHDVPVALLAQLRSTWEAEIRPSARRALSALAAALVIGLAHLARRGTPAVRATVAALLAAFCVFLVARAIVLHRRRQDPRRTILETIGPTDPELAAATVRGLGLVEQTTKDATRGSPSLARLHLARLLSRASIERIAERASVAARRWSVAGLVFALVAVFGAAIEQRVVEGLDVLVARNGEAPLPLAYLEDVNIVAKPPEYLHQHGRVIDTFEATSLPRGTMITVHGRPTFPSRTLVLTDGKVEVPFALDGVGGVVARWELGETATLRIAARFGDVRIPQADVQEVTSIPDLAPKVLVEDAPRTVRMLDEPEIVVSYEATDDHGLREVDLVYRSGGREARRVLSRPQGDPTSDRGSHRIVFGGDAFFKRNFLPVEITVEARDNDPIVGPKWGKSAAIVVVPPQVGEPEAIRYEALVRARDALTDLVAMRLVEEAPKGTQSADHVKKEREAQEKALGVVEEALAGTYGGLRFPRRALALARGQLRRLEVALAEEQKAPSAATHQKLVEESEAVLLAIDAAAHSLGTSDTRRVAKRLATVADEAAEATAVAAGQRGSETANGVARLDAAVSVLDGGGKQLLRLGQLGLDLGEIVANGLRRIDRARKANDLFHAELAARDLAARLRNPDPSFAGGGGSGSGTESGAGGSGTGDGDPSSADDAAEAGEQELEDLIREHGDELEDVEQALERAFSQDELDELKDEAKKHAEAIREAIKNLPRRAGEPGSATAAGKQARDLAESMADALEQGRPRDAVQSGKEAMRALEDAKKRGASAETWDLGEQSAGREAERARPGLGEELAWAEEALEKLRKSAAERAKGDLEKSGKREAQMAERARKLGEKGAQGDGSLPEETLDLLDRAEKSMRDAERALAEGDGEAGLEHQQNAQRLLEMARGERNNEENENSQERPESSDGRSMAKKADIPGKDGHKGPDAFRKRVLEGLGGSSDPLLKEAVKRYAEGLLR